MAPAISGKIVESTQQNETTPGDKLQTLLSHIPIPIHCDCVGQSKLYLL